MKTNIIGLRDLREHTDKYIDMINKGESFIVIRRSKPIFKISLPEEEDRWEAVIDFSKIKKGGVNIDEVLARL